MPRRLAAILVADIVGYSRLMGRDEAGTLRRFAALRAELIDPAIERHSGRVFKSMGDALLVEFASVVDAVTCAMAICAAMSDDADDALRFRFGIHLGDVIAEGDDLFGDAVNIAARVEAEAEPGGIVISEDAARHARGKIGAGLTDLGPRQLKNIAEPVRIFRVDAEGEGEGGAALVTHASTEDQKGRKATLALVPLRHLGDPALAYLSEGLSDGLATALGLFDMFDLVEWTGGDPEPPDYLLDGTVQIAGPRARINVRLSEQASGRRVWGTTYDRPTDDPFALQDDLIATIACTIGEAIPEEAAKALASKQPETYTAQDWLTDGLQKLHRLDPEGVRLSRISLRRAQEIDPDLSNAQLVLGFTYAVAMANGWPTDQDDPLEYALSIARDLVRQNEHLSNGWRLLSRLLLFSDQIDEALAHIRRAHEINPYDSDIIINHGMLLIRIGRIEEGLPLVERACRINPYAPSYYQSELGLAHLLAGRPEAALEALQGLSRPVGHSRLTHAATLVELGRVDEAQELIREHLADLPEATIASASSLSDGPHADRYAEMLTRAGLPRG